MSLTIRVASNFWVKWAEIALAHGRDAMDGRERAVAAEPGSQAMGEAFDDELQAGLVAVVAAAFAIDAWYIAVRDMAPLSTKTESGLRASSSPRRAWVIETLKAGFATGPTGASWGRGISEVYKLRDRAVHHTSDFHETTPHPTGLSNVSRENSTYTAEVAAAAAGLAVEVIATCLANPRSKLPDLVAWCADRAHVGPDLLERRRRALGS
jgi:hypothetical protein